ncbi:MAG: FtsX-like permease family protein, partial [Bacteroidota bacterium]
MLNLEYFIAKRVATDGSSTTAKSFSRLIIRIAIVATALSVSVMIIATAVIAGFKSEISDKIFGFWGHIRITDTNVNRSFLEEYPININQPFYPDITDVAHVNYVEQFQIAGIDIPYQLNRSTKGGIAHIQAYALKPGIIKADEQIEGIILKGIGTDFNWDFLNQYLVRGRAIALPDSSMSREIVISEQTANRLRLDTGSVFRVHFIGQDEQPIRRFSVSGIYKTGLEEYDARFALVDIRQLQRLLGWSTEQVGGFEVFVEDLRDLQPLTDYVYYNELPSNLYAENLRESATFGNIFHWLELQDINEAVILSLMIIVSIINMVTALMILILERTQMIGTLKALGMSNWSIRKIFLNYAAYIILLGLLWGNIIGIALCWI